MLVSGVEHRGNPDEQVFGGQLTMNGRHYRRVITVNEEFVAVAKLGRSEIFAFLSSEAEVRQILTVNVHSFVDEYDERDIDVDAEGCEPIPEVLNHFTALGVDPKLADAVTSIDLDGGGKEIYLQIAPRWDGEDGVFGIELSRMFGTSRT